MVRIVLTASVLVVAALGLTGCASSTHAQASTAAKVRVHHPSLLPGETEFSFDDGREAPSVAHVKATSMHPNAQERPTHGAIHPATY